MDIETRKILDMLLEKSKKKEVKWERSANTEGRYLVRIKGNKLIIDKLEDEKSSVVGYRFRVTNEWGDEILSEAGLTPFVDDKLIKVYEEAEKSFLKKDEIISEITNALSNEGEVGEDFSIPF